MTEADHLYVWTIYKRMQPFPDEFIARKWEILKGESVDTGQMKHSVHLEEIRWALQQQGLVCLPRMTEDEEHIIESWI